MQQFSHKPGIVTHHDGWIFNLNELLIPSVHKSVSFTEHKFNKHFSEAVKNSFLLISYIHYPEQHLFPLEQKPTTVSLIIHKSPANTGRRY